ncbi:helix-turn-helix domain-containing protein [Sporosarcina cascadiensis]|uniref:helix-turn-helix domain-containing protein n=1 Tax=Sporosarcina cascadiensis TaxID=2660747 RepID=UPI00129A284B|nr:helix-turn-helix domain-containing protein [Sporosarcina cascadiensis]
MITVGVYHHEALFQILSAQEGFQVIWIPSLKEAEMIRALDLLIADISLDEEVEYRGTFTSILQENVQLKIIFLKDTFSFNEMKQLIKAGAYDCLDTLETCADPEKLLPVLMKAGADLKRERRQKKRDTAYMLRSIRECLAYDLLYGNSKNAKEIWERSKLAELSLIPNTVLLLSIDHFSWLVENKGELWKNALREEVLQAIRETHLHYESLKVLVTEEKYAILLALPVQVDEANYKALSIEYAEKIRAEINRKTDYTVTIGIGNYFEDARNLHLSYQESKQAQAYRLFSTENSIIHIEDLDYFETTEYYDYKMQIQSITEKFSLGDLDGVRQQWEDVYCSIASHVHIEPEEFRLQVLDLLFSLSKSAIQNGASPKNMMPLQIKHAKELHELETLAEIDACVKTIITEYSEQVDEGHNEQSLKSVKGILQFIEDHYHEDIGLETVAAQVELSPNYVSAIFKQTTGSSFSYYLTERRMKKAKHLLEDLNMTIYEVAESVGYSSSQYFSRVFKNHVDMTPTAYRNSVLSTKY